MASSPTSTALSSGVRPSSTFAHWHSLPNVLVFTLLAGVMLLGHVTGWKLPKLSTLLGSHAADSDWCSEHLVPESQCLECQTNLKPALPEFGWCGKHGVAECVLCHPELAQTAQPPAEPLPDTLAAIQLRERPTNNSRSTLHTKVVQFASRDAVEKAGVEVDVVGTGPVREEITANGEATFDPTRVAHLSPRVPGTAWKVLKRVGEAVAEGETLALIDAAAVGQAKTHLLQAVAELQLRTAMSGRLRPVADSVAGRTVMEADAALKEAEIKLISAQQTLLNLGFRLPEGIDKREPKLLAEDLRYLGMPEGLTPTVKNLTQTTNLIPLVSPIQGVLVEADVVSGEVIDTNTKAFVVADPQSLWLTLNVRQEDAGLVSLGQEIAFETDDGRSQARGTLEWMSPAIDPRTRTLAVRATLHNEQGALRDGTYGLGRIVLREQPHAIMVPREAVHTAGDVHLIFVRDKNYFQPGAPSFFHVRQVRLGAGDEKHVELLAGALPGEVIATKGSNVLLAQVLRSQLGAGCGCHNH